MRSAQLEKAIHASSFERYLAVQDSLEGEARAEFDWLMAGQMSSIATRAGIDWDPPVVATPARFVDQAKSERARLQEEWNTLLAEYQGQDVPETVQDRLVDISAEIQSMDAIISAA